MICSLKRLINIVCVFKIVSIIYICTNMLIFIQIFRRILYKPRYNMQVQIFPLHSLHLNCHFMQRNYVEL